MTLRLWLQGYRPVSVPGPACFRFKIMRFRRLDERRA